MIDRHLMTLLLYLDHDLLQQYFNWIWNGVGGNLEQSSHYSLPFDTVVRGRVMRKLAKCLEKCAHAAEEPLTVVHSVWQVGRRTFWQYWTWQQLQFANTHTQTAMMEYPYANSYLFYWHQLRIFRWNRPRWRANGFCYCFPYRFRRPSVAFRRNEEVICVIRFYFDDELSELHSIFLSSLINLSCLSC